MNENQEKLGAEAYKNRRYSADTRARLANARFNEDDAAFRKGFEAERRRQEEEMYGGEYECV